MSEWTYKSLGQLAVFQKGRKVETSEHPRDGFEPYLGATALAGGTNEFGDAGLGIRAQAGDVLMLWDGERSGLVGKGRSGVLSSTVTKLTSRGEIVGDFLYYALDSSFEWIQNRRTGTGVPHVPKDLGRILRLGFPANKAEQQRIAEILGTVDEAIEATEALIAKQQHVKAGLMHDLFTRGLTPDGNLRPPPTAAPALYHQTPLGLMPKEWMPASISSVGEVITGNTPEESSLERSDRGVPFITPGDVNADVFVDSTERSLIGRITGRARPIPAGSICVVCIGSTIGKLAMAQRDSITNQQINSVVCAKPELASFFYFSMSQYLPAQLRREAGLQAVPIVNKSTFSRMIVPAPHEEQEAKEIQRRMLTATDSLAAEAARLAKLRQQKQGLMQALLTPPGGG